MKEVVFSVGEEEGVVKNFLTKKRIVDSVCSVFLVSWIEPSNVGQHIENILIG